MEKLASELLGVDLSNSLGPIKGVQVDLVKPGMGADRCGLRVGDLIQICESQALCNQGDLTRIVAGWVAKTDINHRRSDVYAAINISVLRSGILIEKAVPLRKNPDRTSSIDYSTHTQSHSRKPSPDRRKLSGYSNENGGTSKIAAPYLGFTINVVLGPPRGLLVVKVAKDQPGHSGGIRVGDVIIKIDNEVVELGSSLINLYRKMRPSDEVVFTVLRDETEEIDCRVIVGSQTMTGNQLEQIIAKLRYESEVALSMQLTPLVKQMEVEATVLGRRASLPAHTKLAETGHTRPRKLSGDSDRSSHGAATEIGLSDYEILNEATRLKLHYGLGMETARGNIKGVLVTKGSDSPDGLITGDLIQMCNNVPTADMLHLAAEWCRAAKWQKTNGNTLVLTVLRSGRFLIDRTLELPSKFKWSA